MKKYTLENCPSNISGIYKIDFPNGKVYIGKAVDIKTRIREHNTDTKQEVLYCAITKYFQNQIPEFYILEEVPREQLNEREKYYIALYDSYRDKSKGYNLTPGGDGAALGIDNVASKFTQEDINTIIHLLETTSIPMTKIAQEYNCSRNTIERLNSGITYFNSKIDYPIRKEKYIPKSGTQNGNSSLNEEQLQQLFYELQLTQIPMKDLAIKYHIANSTLSNINNGKSYYNSNYNYPLRAKNSQHKKVFSQDELELIKSLLLQNKKVVSMTDIGNQLKCDRKIIAEINQGKRQRQNDWDYPIRK